MEIQQISLRGFRRNLTSSFFEEAYIKLQLNKDLNDTEIQNLLKNAIIFTNFGDLDL